MQKEESLRNIRNASTASKFLFSSAHMDENKETGGKVVIDNYEYPIKKKEHLLETKIILFTTKIIVYYRKLTKILNGELNECNENY